MSKKTKVKKEAARKEKLRQEKHRGQLKAHSGVKKKITIPDVSPDLFPDDQHVFWLAHGVNYIVSDYENGVWSPMFPDIYEGKAISTDDMAQAIVQRFGTVGKDWSSTGKVALAWSVQSRGIIFTYYTEALRRLKAKDPKCDAEALAKQPGNPVVWGVVRYMMDSMSKRKVV